MLISQLFILPLSEFQSLKQANKYSEGCEHYQQCILEKEISILSENCMLCKKNKCESADRCLTAISRRRVDLGLSTMAWRLM